MKRRIFWSVFFTVFLDYYGSTDLRIYCGYFLAICQLGFLNVELSIAEITPSIYSYFLLFDRMGNFLELETLKVKIIMLMYASMDITV